MFKRGMTEEAARQRIDTQQPQENKVAVANFVIRNEGSFDDTWRQVQDIWKKLFPTLEVEPVPVVAAKGELVVERARPRQAGEIADFITRMTGRKRTLGYEDVMAAFGEKAFLLLRMDSRIVGLVGWQVENLVARTDDVYLESSLPLLNAMQKIMGEVEHTSKDLQCEASLLFLPPALARHVALLGIRAAHGAKPGCTSLARGCPGVNAAGFGLTLQATPQRPGATTSLTGIFIATG
jgi:dephospho-CoA kinase